MKREQREQVLWDLHQENEVIVPLEFTEEVNPQTFGLEVKKANEMVSGLTITIAEREILKNAYIDVIDLPINTETLPIFKELRLKIVKNRTQGIEKWHKINKEFYLSGGRFVDAIKNKEILVNQEMESKLLEAEKFFENQEKEKKRILNEKRILRISEYMQDTIGLDFSEMNDYDFDDFVLGKKTRFENELKERQEELLKIENERLAEIERQRLAEIENEKIRIENLRLQEEARLREIEIQKERAKVEAENNLKLEAERKERAKVEAELQAKKDLEIKIENERLAKIKEVEKLAKKSSEIQLKSWIESFNIEIPETLKDNILANEILMKFLSFKSWSNNQIN